MHYLLILLILLTLWQPEATATVSAYCPEIKAKHIPITGIRAILVPTDAVSIYTPSKLKMHSFKLTVKTMKYEVVNKCCAGYNMNNSGVCEPICEARRCSEFEECIEPNVCRCKSGYKAAIDSMNATCLPSCANDCGQHAHCQAWNLCVCDLGYVASKSNTSFTGGVHCQRRCRAGVLWDPLTLTCFERQEANVTVIAAEMDLFMPDIKAKQVENIEGGGDGQLDAFIVSKNTASTTSSSTEIPESKTSGCLTLVHALIGLGVTVFLLTFAAVALYIFKRLQHSNSDVILEDKNDLPGEYFIDRSQILVY